MNAPPFPLAALATFNNLATGLPAACIVAMRWNLMRERWEIDAQLDAATEADEIDAVRTWAAALNGVTELSEPHAGYDGTYRSLDAVGSLAGVSVRAWAHIARTPAAIPAAA